MHRGKAGVARLNTEPSVVRRVFGLLPWLTDVSLSTLPWMDDTIFTSAPGIPDFPALDTLRLHKMGRITAEGLIIQRASDGRKICPATLR